MYEYIYTNLSLFLHLQTNVAFFLVFSVAFLLCFFVGCFSFCVCVCFDGNLMVYAVILIIVRSG